MFPHTVLRALGATVFLLPVVSAHMQMLIPSPLRDPNSNRKDEPKDYNILTPLHADGSDFACKGYQWNTPWTTVATYEAGKTYKMTLKGSATHGGGSCQLSLSCDGGIQFKVIKSIVGGCPLEKQYPFTIPPEFARTSKATCLFAWTWFNKIGNREMYMNCAVVDIVPKKRPGSKSPTTSNIPRLNGRDVARANAGAQSLLAGYPDLFVANLKNVNSCTVRETVVVVFDNPGQAVSFGDGASGSSAPSFKRGVCTGAGLSSADSSAYSSTSSTGGWKETSSSNGGQDWTWKGGDSSGQSTSESQGDDGQWHGGSQAGQTTAGNTGQWQPQSQTSSNAQQDAGSQLAAGTNNQQEQTQINLSPVDLNEVGQQPDANVQSDLDAYLAKLYGKNTSSRKRDLMDVDNLFTQDFSSSDADFAKVSSQEQAKMHDRFENQAYSTDDPDESYYKMNKNFLYRGTRTHLRRITRQMRWESYSHRRDVPLNPNREASPNTGTASSSEATSNNEATTDSEATTETHQGAALVFAPLQSKSDAAYYAILAKLNSLGDTVFTLMKFASTYLDSPPPPDRFVFAAVSSENGTVTTMKKRASVDDKAEKAKLRASLVEKLSGLQDEVSELLQSAENKLKTSKGVWNRVKRCFTPPVWKRQLVIPGIIPATVQNSEPFYFAAPIASGVPESEDHHGVYHNEHNDTKGHVEMEDTACTFNLSLIDRCMSKQTFLSTIPSDEDKAPTTANLLDALQMCASTDAECSGENIKSSREDRLAEMNDNCQGIFMTIGHCLLDDKDIEHVWNSLDLGNLTTLKETPLRASLYTCVQKNVFCATGTQPTPSSSEESEEAKAFNPLLRCDPADLKCQVEAIAYAAKLAAEMKQHNQTAYSPTTHSKIYASLIPCAEDDLGCIAHAKLQDLKYASLNQPRISKRQDDGAEEPGAAEALFPDVSHNTLYDGLEDPTTAQPYDWGSIYTDADMGQDGSGRIPAVVGPKPVANWPSPSEDPVYTGGKEVPVVGPTPVYSGGRESPVVGPTPISGRPSPSEDQVYSDGREAPVVGPTPVSDWDTQGEEGSAPEPMYPPPFQVANNTSNSSGILPLGTAVSAPSQTTRPTPYDGTNNQNLTLGEALKLAFPELINHKPIGEPIDQPPRYTQPKEEDSWRDGVFPGLLDARQRPPPPTHTLHNPSPSPSSSPDTDDEDVAALLPYILGPGPAQPPGVTGAWPSPQQTGNPDNLETMPQVIDDLGPEDEEQIRKFFSELAKQANATASPTSSSLGNLETKPALINDLTPEDEASVRAFFSSLSLSAHASSSPSPTPSSSPSPYPPHHPHAPRQLPPIVPFPSLSKPSPTPSTCAPDRAALRALLTLYHATLRTPCNTTPYVQMSGSSKTQVENSLRNECRENRRRIGGLIGVVTEVLNGGCEGVEGLVRGTGTGVGEGDEQV